MIDSMTIITRWNSLFDWRLADISKTNILDSVSSPMTCMLSADAWGLKGKLPGCKHSWIASFDGNKWKTYEITDLETVKKAITAAKDGKGSLHPSAVSKSQSPVSFRPEQREAIEKTNEKNDIKEQKE